MLRNNDRVRLTSKFIKVKINMLSFETLNDYEFEVLAKDIISRKLGISFYQNPKGRDGGIDLYDNAQSAQYIVQVKHYAKTSKNRLLSDLKKELNKIEKLEFNNYIIIVSHHLSFFDRSELLQHFSGYILEDSHILDGDELKKFLNQDENVDILKNHTKLWLTSPHVFEFLKDKTVDMDTEILLEEITQKKPYMVATEQFTQANEYLKYKNILTLVGNPGVGKTTLSYLLILSLIEQGYSVRYASNQSIRDIKEALSLDKELKELVFLDDFLGQHYLNLIDKKPSELKSLIKWISINKNKKLIMNSRTIILEEAKRKYEDLADVMSNDGNELIINCDQLSYKDKGLILYNHLFHNGLERENFKELLKNGFLNRIISHKNYNPRIIEYCSKEHNIMLNESENYPQFILRTLNNSERIWENEYIDRLTELDRLYLQILYSMTNNGIDIDKLEYSFNSAIRKIDNIDKTLNHFDLVTKRLNGSMIKIISANKKQIVSVFNPSVNDFLKKKLKSFQITNNIIKTSIFIDQDIKVIENYDNELYTIKFLENYSFGEKESIKKNEYFWYILFSLKNNYGVKSCIKQNIDYAMDKILNQTSIYSEETNFLTLIDYMLGNSNFNFHVDYGIKILLKTLSIIHYPSFIDMLSKLKDSLSEEDFEIDILDEISDNDIEIILENHFNDILENSMGDYVSNNINFDLIEKNYSIEEFENDIKFDIIDEFNIFLKEYYRELYEFFPEFDSEIDFDDLVAQYDIYNLIEEEISFVLGDWYHDGFNPDKNFDVSDYEEMEKVFESSTLNK